MVGAALSLKGPPMRTLLATVSCRADALAALAASPQTAVL